MNHISNYNLLNLRNEHNSFAAEPQVKFAEWNIYPTSDRKDNRSCWE
ncbi:hypothetical protein [Synechococcus phage BUCT-ZZ01]|nr:hypothetical protein [Synechococcus phage BUCT-ZZ01]